MTDQQLIAELDEFRHQSAELAAKIDALCSQEDVPANVALEAFRLLTIGYRNPAGRQCVASERSYKNHVDKTAEERSRCRPPQRERW
jgi:hypothetical protein